MLVAQIAPPPTTAKLFRKKSELDFRTEHCPANAAIWCVCDEAPSQRYVTELISPAAHPGSPNMRQSHRICAIQFSLYARTELYNFHLTLRRHASHLAHLLHDRTRKTGKIKALVPIGYGPSVSICMVVSESGVVCGRYAASQVDGTAVFTRSCLSSSVVLQEGMSDVSQRYTGCRGTVNVQCSPTASTATQCHKLKPSNKML